MFETTIHQSATLDLNSIFVAKIVDSRAKYIASRSV